MKLLPAAAALASLPRLEAAWAERATFGTAYKGGPPPHVGSADSKWPGQTEITVFEHSCERTLGSPDDGCMMNHFWAGGNWQGYENSVLRYYVDGEDFASVVMPLGAAHGMYDAGDNAPWNAGDLFGNTGTPSGIFNSLHIPFDRRVKVTVWLTDTAKFWIILRGESGVRPRLGIEELPAGARAKTNFMQMSPVAAGQQLAVAESSRSYDSGVVAYTALKVDFQNDTDTRFLEGCYRLLDPTTGDVRMTLSSGTEDYFLGTYYFNRGVYQNPMAGVTSFDHTRYHFSAYRVHTHDHIYFKNGLRMTWRNSDPYSKCDLSNTNPASRDVVAGSFAFFYHW